MSHPHATAPLAELLPYVTDTDLGPDDYLKIEWDGGYVTIEERSLSGALGPRTFTASWHPADGLCHAKPDVVDGSDGTCVHCGRTLM